MEMTIDKAIAKIWHCIVSIRDCVGNKEFVEALELSVETMRKYQKIADLYDNWRSDKCEYTISCMENIGKVLKDEKI